jgi:hypothetical protein
MNEDPFGGLLESPLEDRHPRPWIWIAAGGALAAGLVVALAVAFWPDGESIEEASTTTPAAMAGFPDARVHAPLVATDAGILMVGGLEPLASLNGERFADVWRYDPATGEWWDLQAPDGPPPRAGHAVAYDAGSGLIVLFGGALGSCEYPFCGDVVNDTWVYDPVEDSWEQRAPATPPSPRHGHRMVYSASADRIVLYGGDSSQAWLEDTWLYDTDSDTWTQVAAGEQLPWRTAQHAMVYDPVSDRVVVWGGADREDSPIWAFDAGSGRWEQLDLDPLAGSAWDACMVWHPGSERLLLLGGEGYMTEEIAEGVTSTGIRRRDHVWALDPAAGTWAELEPLPRPMSAHGCVADPGSTNIVIWDRDAVLHYDPVTGRTSVVEDDS